MDQNSEIELRAYNPATDRNFILSTFLKGLYHGNDYYGAIDQKAYYANYGPVVDILLNRASNVVIASLRDDNEVILGWAMVDQIEQPGPDKSFKVHFVFVKKAWRSKGIANQLLKPFNITTVTHITKPGHAISKKRGWKLDPFQIG